MRKSPLFTILPPFFLALVFFSFHSARSQKGISMNALSGDYSWENKEGVFNNKGVEVPGPASPSVVPRKVLGESVDSKKIYIDLTNQPLFAYEGLNKIYEFPISSGLWDRTPRGEFEIWIKLKYTVMQGGSQALGTYYYLPNVPFTMYFYGDKASKSSGYALHGAYWHNNFGQPMSHGCINLKPEDAEKLFYWASPPIGESESVVRATEENRGTKIVVFGKYEPKKATSN